VNHLSQSGKAVETSRDRTDQENSQAFSEAVQEMAMMSAVAVVAVVVCEEVAAVVQAYAVGETEMASHVWEILHPRLRRPRRTLLDREGCQSVVR
jgi:hypothetical protein